jgi:hypothetical protein
MLSAFITFIFISHRLACIEWVLEKIEVNKIPNDRLDGNIRSMIKNLEKVGLGMAIFIFVEVFADFYSTL